MNNSSYVSLFDTKNFNWKYISLNNGSGTTTLTVEASEYVGVQAESNMKKNGTVRIVVSAYGGEEHSEILPHLLHSGNASQMDIIIDGLSTQYKNSRFGLHLITASSDDPSLHPTSVLPRKTMDDQHAPGIFTVVEMKAAGVESGGYLQWRPVVYVTPAREMTSSSESVQYQATPSSDPIKALNNTLTYSLMGDRLASMSVSATNITFGSPNDGFYNKTYYATWSVVVGYGHPPSEKFSMLVTLVLVIGLGLPAVLVLVGGICIVLRRLQRKKDELFLGQ